MAERTEKLRFVVEAVTAQAGGALRGLVTDTKRLDDATEAAERSTEDLSDAEKRLATALERTGTKASAATRDVQRSGDETQSAAKRVGHAYDTMGDSAMGAASSIGEAFGSGGKVSSSLGSLGEVVESVGGMFGPLGLAISAAGGVAIGALSGMLGKSEEKLQAIRDKAAGVVDALIEQQGRLDQAYAETKLREFTHDHLEATEAVRELAGPRGLKLLEESLAGNTQSYQELTAALGDQRDALQAEYETLNTRYAAGERLTDSELRRMNAIPTMIDRIDETTGALEDELGAVDRARREYDLLAEAHRTNKDALDAGYDAMLRQTSALYDQATAAKVARDNIARLAEAESKRSARGEAPAGAVAYVEGKGWVDKKGTVLRGPNRQQGGQVLAGRAYTVGESGPEVFVPASDGAITPAVPAGTTVNVFISAPVATASLIRDAAPVITAAVSDARRRGSTGSLNRVYMGGA